MYSLKSFTLFVALLAFSLTPGIGRAGIFVDPGFDLLFTNPASGFLFDTVPNPQFVNFTGVPLGTYDFGSGPENVDNVSTIIQRTQQADLSGGFATIDIEMVALQLVSVSPVDLGFGAGFEDIFVTLNTSSPSSQSTMTIFDTGEGSPHGSFASELNFSFDITGSIGGNYQTLETTMIAGNCPWQHEPTGLPIIDGVNHLLNGLDETHDFWPIGLCQHNHVDFVGWHIVSTIPEPCSLTSLGLLSLGMIGFRRRRQ